ncbi:beta strand repeat-containing protein, partial [Helicobacter sp. 'CLO3_human']|uniref:beta strand repeat-containing protein n=2 Tax=unclassified Helicobacter TaxID=2593540 RepID=UPI00131533C3
MNTKNYIFRGREEQTAYIVSSSSKFFQNSFFKPVVASSLALLLGSTLYGDTNISNPNCVESGNCTDITKDINFKFGTGENTQISEDSKTVTFSKKQENVTLKDTNFTGNVFNFPGSTMTINFENRSGDGAGEGINAKRTFNLEATNDFKGNLKIIGGNGNNEVTGKFSKNFEGNFTIENNRGYGGAKVTFTFGEETTSEEVPATAQSSGIFKGDISNNSGTATFTFNKDGEIQGAIQAYASAWKHLGKNIVVFKGTTNTITGKILSSGGSNTITFGGNSVGAVNSETPTNTITGDIIADKDARYYSGSNTITFEKGTSTIKGNVNAYGSGATNTITFNGTTNTIEGNISTGAATYGGDGANTITFNGTTNTITGKIFSSGGTNTLTFGGNSATTNGGSTNTITGDIVAETNNRRRSGNNIITFENGTTNTIKGNISAYGSTNTIVFNGTGANKFIGNVTATSSGYGGNGTNNIKIVGKEASKDQGMGQSNASILDDLSFLAGNIETNNGSTNNIVLENSIWLPLNLAEVIGGIQNSDIKTNLSSLLEDVNISSGTLTNNSGTTNAVLRASGSVFNTSSVTPMFNVENKSGNVNVVVQGQVNIGANVSYRENKTGSTTFIFANSNNSINDAFGHPTDTDTSNDNSAVLGVTYQDGVKLVLKDKTISNNDSFLKTYANYFKDVAEGKGLLTLKTNRSLSSGTQTDTITIKG